MFYSSLIYSSPRGLPLPIRTPTRELGLAYSKELGIEYRCISVCNVLTCEDIELRLFCTSVLNLLFGRAGEFSK